MLRVFVALEMPPEVKEALSGLQEQLRETGLPLRMTRPEGIHLTLAFIGEIAAKRLAELTTATQKGAAGFPALDMQTTQVGAFPNIRRPRAIWVGVTADEANNAALKRLYNNVGQELRAAGFQFDSKLDPHLTIARVREQAHPDQVQAISAALQSVSVPAPISFHSDKVSVIRSVLQAGGSVYTPLATVELGA